MYFIFSHFVSLIFGCSRYIQSAAGSRLGPRRGDSFVSASMPFLKEDCRLSGPAELLESLYRHNMVWFTMVPRGTVATGFSLDRILAYLRRYKLEYRRRQPCAVFEAHQSEDPSAIKSAPRYCRQQLAFVAMLSLSWASTAYEVVLCQLWCDCCRSFVGYSVVGISNHRSTRKEILDVQMRAHWW